jgi:D-alanyl-D-alanine carboxypeptidase
MYNLFIKCEKKYEGILNGENMGNYEINTLDKIFNKTVSSSQIHECVLLVENSNGDFSYSNGYGGKKIYSPLLMASITKLFTTTCILFLQEHGKLLLNDKISKYLDDTIMDGLHIYNGKEYSYELTISDLLFQTSGLPDELEDGRNGVKNFCLKDDSYITFSENLAEVKRQKANFAPSTAHKAYYANINFDLLGRIIEEVTKLPLEKVYNEIIFEPLGLSNTYLPTCEKDFVPNVYYKDKAVHRPKIVMSSRASGGGITTAYDLMKFMKAFFGGKFFNKATFDILSKYNKLQASKGPIYYGGGYMNIPLDGFTTLFMGKGELLGHSGSTGSFAFYYPYKDLFIVGDVNQISNPALPIRLVMKLAMTI